MSNGEKLTPYGKGSELAKEALAARAFKGQFAAQEDDWTNRFVREVALYSPGQECIATAYAYGYSDTRYETKPMRVIIAMRPHAKLEDGGYRLVYNVQPLKADGRRMLRRNNINVYESDLTPLENIASTKASK